MDRQRLAATLALCAALALAGCGGNGTDAKTEADAKQDAPVSEGSSDASLDTSQDSEAEGPADASVVAGDAQVVGSDEYGYVSVPASWVEFVDVDGNSSIQWCDGTDQTIISLNRFDLESVPEERRDAFGLEDAGSIVWDNMINDGAEEDSIEGAHVTLGGHEAVQVYGMWPDGSFLVTWLVDDDAGGIRYVAAEGTDLTIMDAVSIVEDTWTL